MGNEQKFTGKMEVAGVMGPLWLTGWLFTIGFAHLGVTKALLGLALWPYYLGVLLSRSPQGAL
ncbi:MAG TPA: hypothetical protein PLL30_11000 [Candidatus Krumholzibacteria bacterium]|nr:hypothetical protein [Candidatus Krumholzibacteria bacterium]HPD72292.1 hypothetical protein [Candidatus Krumholzibacteria bacterium]HRY40776.1 hypothetical protein [Candidatus Krumholzibacteria bacterium]